MTLIRFASGLFPQFQSSRKPLQILPANLIPVLVEAVKTLHSKVERLQNVEAENALLKAKQEALEACLNALEAALRSQK